MKRPFYVRVAVSALLLVPASLIFLLVALLATGGRPPEGVLVLLAMQSAVCIVCAGLLTWSDRWFTVPAAFVLFLVTLGGFGLSLEYGLSHPESFFDFVTGIVTVVGPLVAVVACMIVLVQRVRKTRERAPRRGERRAVLAIPIVVILIAIVSAILTVTQQPLVIAEGDGAIVTMKDDRFVPDELEVRRGDRVAVVLDNRDSYAHTFSIDELGLDTYVGPRAKRLIEIDVTDVPKLTSVGLYCAVTGHDDMTGTVFIEGAGG